MWIPTGAVAIVMALVGTLGWGSWGNMLVLSKKLHMKDVRFEVFYVDFMLSIWVMATIYSLIFGQIEVGNDDRTFLVDDWDFSEPDMAKSAMWVFGGGIVWNFGNIFLCKGIDLLGLALAFPLGVGMALWIGAAGSYAVSPAGNNPTYLFSGCAVAFVAVCIAALTHHFKNQTEKEKEAANFDATKEEVLESGDMKQVEDETKPKVSFTRSLILVLLSGLGLGFSGLLPVKGFQNAVGFVPGRLSPYGAMWWYTFGAVASTFIIVPLSLLYPLDKAPRVPFGVFFHDYFHTPFTGHLVCLGAGAIWGTGFLGVYSTSQSPDLSPSISYAIGQCAPLIGILSGLAWGEFQGQKLKTWIALVATVLTYIGAVVLLTLK